MPSPKKKDSPGNRTAKRKTPGGPAKKNTGADARAYASVIVRAASRMAKEFDLYEI